MVNIKVSILPQLSTFKVEWEFTTYETTKIEEVSFKDCSVSVVFYNQRNYITTLDYSQGEVSMCLEALFSHLKVSESIEKKLERFLGDLLGVQLGSH